MRPKIAFFIGMSLLVILMGSTAPSNAIIAMPMTFKYSVKKGETYTWKVTSVDTGITPFSTPKKVGDEYKVDVLADPNQLTGQLFAGNPESYLFDTGTYYFQTTTPDGKTTQTVGGGDYILPISSTLNNGTVLNSLQLMVLLAKSGNFLFYKVGDEFSFLLNYYYVTVWTYSLKTGLLTSLSYTDTNGKTAVISLQTPATSKGGFLGLPLPTAPIFVGFVAIGVIVRKQRKYVALQKEL